MFDLDVRYFKYLSYDVDKNDARTLILFLSTDLNFGMITDNGHIFDLVQLKWLICCCCAQNRANGWWRDKNMSRSSNNSSIRN